MAIPDYQTIMLPLLRLVADGKEHKRRETTPTLADHFQLTKAERARQLPSGQGLFDNRVGWARTYLKQAGLLAPVRWGVITITDQGLALLSRNPKRIDKDVLYEYQAFREFRARIRKKPRGHGLRRDSRRRGISRRKIRRRRN